MKKLMMVLFAGLFSSALIAQDDALRIGDDNPTRVTVEEFQAMRELTRNARPLPEARELTPTEAEARSYTSLGGYMKRLPDIMIRDLNLDDEELDLIVEMIGTLDVERGIGRRDSKAALCETWTRTGDAEEAYAAYDRSVANSAISLAALGRSELARITALLDTDSAYQLTGTLSAMQEDAEELTDVNFFTSVGRSLADPEQIVRAECN